MAKGGKGGGYRNWAGKLGSHFGLSADDFYDDYDDDYDLDDPGLGSSGPAGPIGADGQKPSDVTLGDYVEKALDEAAQKRALAIAKLSETLRSHVPAGATPGTLVEHATDDDLGETIAAATTLAGQLDAASGENAANYTNDHVKGWNTRLDGIVQAVTTAKQTIKEREEARDRLLTAIEKVEPPEGSEQKETEELGQAVRTARELANTGALDVEATESALKIAEDLVEKIKEAARLRKEAHDTLDEELTQLVDIDCLPGQQPKQDELRKAASDLLEPPITEDRNTLAREAIDALKTWQGETKQALEDLGGKEQAQAFCDAFGVDPDKMAELETQLGGHDAVVALLKKPGLAKVKEYAAAFGGGAADPAKFAEMVTGFGSFDALQAAVDAVGSVEKLSALTVKGGLTPAAAKDMIDGLGGGFVAELMGSGNDPATAKALVTELGGELKNFGTIAKAAGLDAKPKALMALLDTGCKGNAKDFAALITDTFKDTDDQKALKGLIETGGFGDAPDALGGFFANGLGGDGKNLKEFCTALDTPAAREGLNFLRNDAGLKGDPGKISDHCLSALFPHGAGPVPTQPPPDQAKLQS
ncbi:MAG: hypothetical protein AB3N09_14110, partial [Tateyamaria sp.]